MTKLEVFKCDRCGKEFNVREGGKHDQVFIHPHWANDPIEEKDLCFDCAISLQMFFEEKHIKVFDQLADKLSEEIE